ncbi:hypothetical protein [Halobellus sp. Atlit-38R]|uniref:hypothetical protein n=1 Tax=Halobellus sp. Atlit-38R TaxID=2282131 RepID=UPI0018F6BEAA|nr:hypothetical protein [Halobellus sp. Atlit-38R]
MTRLVSVRYRCSECDATHVRPEYIDDEEPEKTREGTCYAAHPARDAGFEGCGEEVELEAIAWREDRADEWDAIGADEQLVSDGGQTADESLLRVISDRDPAEMSHHDLYYEWHEVVEATYRSITDADVERTLTDRREELWNEMTSRVDAEAPECPECGAQSWGQTRGEPKICRSCDYHLGIDDDALGEAINDYWNAVQSPGVQPPEGGEADD